MNTYTHMYVYNDDQEIVKLLVENFLLFGIFCYIALFFDIELFRRITLLIK